jgi:hypothetical protein
MSVALWMALMLSTGAGNGLVPVGMGAVQVSVPGNWHRSNQGGTAHFGAPSGEAYFEVDVGKVQTAGMQASVCVSKITTGIGGTAWRPRTIGGAPAALKVDSDTDSKGQQFISYTYVGCDGANTWALTFHWVSAQDQRYSPLAEKIASSLRYGSRR